MSAWIGWRLAKLLGVILFAVGVALSASPGAAGRSRGAVVAAAGFLATWAAGYGMLKATGASMGAPWVSASMLSSLIALSAAQAGGRWSTLAWAGLGASLGAMVGRGEGWAAPALIGAAVSAAAALVVARAAMAGEGAQEGGEPRARDQGFWWWARLEGISAILLFFVYMPLKYGAGVVLDGGQGWFGWVHGALTVVYLCALPAAGRAYGWGVGTLVMAVAAALIPAGTFVFEARARR